MKRSLLYCILFLGCFSGVKAQNVFDINDPQIRYSASQPVGSAQNPDPTKAGLQKWVSTPSNGISSGTGAWDNSSYKAYFLNLKSKSGANNQMPYRIKFPHSWGNPDSAGKKYPIAVFFHGAGEFGCPTNNGLFNNEKQLVHGGKTFRDRVDQNLYDGFLVYPQDYNPDGCWGNWPSSATSKYNNVLAMVDSLAKYVRADIDRLFAFGLSAGGVATWALANSYPTRVAKIAPSSGLAPSAITNYLPFVHIPIWLATGGKDTAPSPGSAQNQVNKVNAVGGNIRYTLYPDLGHAVWNTHWAEPDFVPYMNATHKANPLIFFQRDAFCPDDTFSVKMGITAGFYSYEWEKDGVLIARINGTTKTILDGSSIVSFEGNNITVKSFGTYRVRFKRSSAASATFSDWSPVPAVISPKPVTKSPPIQVDGIHSKVLPAPDGSNAVPLTLADNYAQYKWYRSSDEVLVSSVQKYDAPVGTYKSKVYEQYGCGSSFSDDFTVIAANGSPKPDPAKNLTATSLSQTAVELNWVKNPNGGSPETGFEIYRAAKAGGPYTLVKITGPNVITYQDNNLVASTEYFYIVRAVNDFGAAPLSNEIKVRTGTDNTAPTAPTGLMYRGSTSSSVDLRWQPSTDDVGVTRYDIYSNDTKIFSTRNTYATLFGLDSLKMFAFYVKAVDAIGNQSPASSQVVAYTHQQGLNYKYYTGTWSKLPNFNSLTPVKTGITDTVNAGANIRTVSDRYGFLWEGFIYIPVSGSYTFETYSDDGSKLYIDVPYSNNATALVSNDGAHGAQYRSGTKTLTEGYHSIAITYFEATGGEEMQVLWSSTAAGIARERIPKNYFSLAKGDNLNPPAMPSSLAAEGTAYNRITLSWNDAANNESGYEIIRSISSGGTYVQVGRVGENITSFTDSGVAPQTTYYYKARAVSNTGNSAYTAIAEGTSLALPDPPAVPGTPALTVQGTASIRISFSDNSDNETGFEIWRSASDQNNFRKVTSLPPSSGNQVLYTDNGLFSNVTYYYKVRAIAEGNNSAFSPVASATTFNTDPTIEAVPDFSMKYGTSFSLALKAADADSDPLVFSADNLPSFAVISSNGDGTGTIVFSPTSAEQGTFAITVKVSDGRVTSSTTFNLVVNSNAVPQLDPVPDTFLKEGEEVDVDLHAIDEESQNALTWQVTGMPSFISFTDNGDGSGSLKVKPGYASSGDYSVTVRVEDPSGAWATVPVKVTVYEMDPNETVRLNFKYFTGGVSGWNDIQLQQNTNSSPPEPYFNSTNLANSSGANSGIGITVVSGTYKAAQSGQVTGNNSGIYPDNVIKDQMIWGWSVGSNLLDTVVLKVTGLATNRKYDFVFFASFLSGSATSKTTYKIGSASATTFFAQNTSNTVSIEGVVPDASGNVLITMIGDANTSRGGVLNALVINANFQDGTTPVKPTNVSANMNSNGSVQIEWKDNAYNETNYRVYRSAAINGPWTQLNTSLELKDSSVYVDASVDAFTTYYYYVAGVNAFGEGQASDTVSVTTGNMAPVISGLSNLYVKTDGSIERNFDVTDAVGEVLNVKLEKTFSFVQLQDLSSGHFRLSVNPTVDNIGQTPVTVVAADDKGAVSKQTIIVNVADKFTRSMFINLGSISKTAPFPWNNWLGSRAASSRIYSLLDENGTVTPYFITSYNKWGTLTDNGMLTGNNTGAYIDSVLESGIVNTTTTPMQFLFSGLDQSKKYNLVFMSSQNEGLDASTEFKAGTQADTLNGSYNSNRTANLNGLTPDASGNILVTISKIGSAYATYLNGMVLEEYDPALSVLNPANLYAEPVDRNTVKVSWSDRSDNEDMLNGFELQRATDSLFTQDLATFSLPGYARNYTNTGLTPNTKYWYRIRANSAAIQSEFSNRAKAITPQSTVHVNFNYLVANAAAPWNNLATNPVIAGSFPNLVNQSGTNTGIQVAIEQTFNGEFTAGKNTGNNSGVVPDAVLASNFWLDNSQKSTIRISGLNLGKRYRFGFIGSSSPQGWYKANYTATYTISDRTVYLNSWENSGKMVFIPDVVADENGEVLITMSTTQAAAYGFNAGITISSYDDATGGPVTVGTLPMAVAPQRAAALESAAQQSAIASAKAYPNPFVESINVDFINPTGNGTVSMDWFDVSGKLVYRRQYGYLPSGFNTLRVNTGGAGLKTGLYIINLNVDGKAISSFRMVKTNK